MTEPAAPRFPELGFYTLAGGAQAPAPTGSPLIVDAYADS